MIARLIEFTESLPEWLRPAVWGAAALFAIVGIRMAFLLPLLLGQPAKLAEFALGLLAATGAGAVGGLAWSLLGRPLRTVPLVGPYLAGVVCIGGYVGALLVAAPYISSQRLISGRADLVIYVAVTIFFGAVFGHSAFRD